MKIIGFILFLFSISFSTMAKPNNFVWYGIVPVSPPVKISVTNELLRSLNKTRQISLQSNVVVLFKQVNSSNHLISLAI